MNYRHRFHAGNFADVLKHTLLIGLLRALQRKEKGLLYLDTHAGAGRYDLSQTARGDTLERTPEWPDGIGRLWTRSDVPPMVADYVSQVRAFDGRERSLLKEGPGPGDAPKRYPGSPLLMQQLLRPQDRMYLCERHPDEHALLRSELDFEARARVEHLDGYTGMRAALPPLERRALVLVDPPYEEAREHSCILEALGDGLRRLPGGTFAVWYPLTERARADAFLEGFLAMQPPPSWTAELTVVGPHSVEKLKGCGMLVVNPPWQMDLTVSAFLPWLGDALAKDSGGGAGLRWLVPE